MKPILYQRDEIAFDSNGLGVLTDAIACTVSEELNGAYELEMQYPVAGIHYAEIAPRCIILAKPDPYAEPQPFRVYRISRPLSGAVTVYAEHVSYDLSGVPVSPFTAHTALEAMQKLKSEAAVDSPFVFATDNTAGGEWGEAAPASTRAALFDARDAYGGDLLFDRWAVKLLAHRGQEDGTTIRYGKNLTDLQQEENIQNVATGIYPYWKASDGTLVTLPEKILDAPGTYDFVTVLPVDFSQDIKQMPSADTLRAAAQAYMAANNIGVPDVSLEVSFLPLDQSAAALERVQLGDAVSVDYARLGVSATARCVKTIYNVLLDRYDSVTLGEVRQTVADTIVSQQREISGKVSSADVDAAVSGQVDVATGWLSDDARGYLTSIIQNSVWQALLVKDAPGTTSAQNILRMDKDGLSVSRDGAGGPFSILLPIDGQQLTIPAIVADSGTLAGVQLTGAGHILCEQEQAGGGKIQLSGGEDAAGNSLQGCVQCMYLRIGDAYYYDDGTGLKRAAITEKLPSEVTA